MTNKSQTPDLTITLNRPQAGLNKTHPHRVYAYLEFPAQVHHVHFYIVTRLAKA